MYHIFLEVHLAGMVFIVFKHLILFSSFQVEAFVKPCL